jgi:glutamine synthetase
MSVYTILRTGLEGPMDKDVTSKTTTRFLPDNIGEAIRLFRESALTKKLFGDSVRDRYADLKAASADRCPRALGSIVKVNEVQFHHEVTNQFLWNQF